MKQSEIFYLLGGTIGIVTGLVLAKVYQIWAILYETEGFRLEGANGWESKPLWKIVNENPGTTTFLTTFCFFLIGISFTYSLTRKK